MDAGSLTCVHQLICTNLCGNLYSSDINESHAFGSLVQLCTFGTATITDITL